MGGTAAFSRPDGGRCRGSAITNLPKGPQSRGEEENRFVMSSSGRLSFSDRTDRYPGRMGRAVRVASTKLATTTASRSGGHLLDLVGMTALIRFAYLDSSQTRSKLRERQLRSRLSRVV